MLTIEHAHSPAYANKEGTCIALQVKFAEFNEEMPFGAASYDCMAYGVELYNRALAGEFGPIEAFVDVAEAIEPQPVSNGAQTL
jgi:hypothetical protein